MNLSNKTSVKILIIMWIVSLLLPGVSYDILDGFGTRSDPGFLILLIGWGGIFSGLFSWYANPLALISIISLNKQKYSQSLFLSIISVAIGLQAIFFEGKPIEMVDSNPNFGTLSIGYYLWIITLVLLMILCIKNFIENNHNPETGVMK